MVAVRQTRSRHEELPLEDLANLASPVRAVLSHRVSTSVRIPLLSLFLSHMRIPIIGLYHIDGCVTTPTPNAFSHRL